MFWRQKSGIPICLVSYLLENTTEVYKSSIRTVTSRLFIARHTLISPTFLITKIGKGTETATTEQQGYTLLVPSNEAVTQFEETVLARARVEKLSDLSLTTLGYFLKAHMVDRIIWPSQFANEQEYQWRILNAGKG